MQLRIATCDELPFLRQMLFEAAYWRPDSPRPSLEEGLANSELGKILADWGRDGDLAVIVHDGQRDTGAAWLRFWTEANQPERGSGRID